MNNGSCGCNRLSDDVLRSAGISSRIFRVGVHNIQCHETKAVGLYKSGASLDRFIIVEPFDFHRCIGHGYQSALEVRPLAFFDLNVVQRGGEDWCLSGCLLDIFSPLVSGSILEIVNLFEASLVPSVRQDLCSRSTGQSAGYFVAANEIDSATGVGA